MLALLTFYFIGVFGNCLQIRVDLFILFHFIYSFHLVVLFHSGLTERAADTCRSLINTGLVSVISHHRHHHHSTFTPSYLST